MNNIIKRIKKKIKEIQEDDSLPVHMDELG